MNELELRVTALELVMHQVIGALPDGSALIEELRGAMYPVAREMRMTPHEEARIRGLLETY